MKTRNIVLKQKNWSAQCYTCIMDVVTCRVTCICKKMWENSGVNDSTDPQLYFVPGFIYPQMYKQVRF